MTPAVFAFSIVAFSGERADDEWFQKNRRLHGHGHPAAGERIDDSRGVANHEDALLDGRFRAKNHGLGRKKTLLRRLVLRVHRLELRLLATQLVDKSFPS